MIVTKLIESLFYLINWQLPYVYNKWGLVLIFKKCSQPAKEKKTIFSQLRNKIASTVSNECTSKFSNKASTQSYVPVSFRDLYSEDILICILMRFTYRTAHRFGKRWRGYQAALVSKYSVDASCAITGQPGGWAVFRRHCPAARRRSAVPRGASHTGRRITGLWLIIYLKATKSYSADWTQGFIEKLL